MAGNQVSSGGNSVDSVTHILASDGVNVPVESLAQTLTYNGPGGALDTVSVSYRGNTYTQTLTYTGSNITTISQWVKQ